MIFPHNVGLGAARDPALMEEIAVGDRHRDGGHPDLLATTPRRCQPICRYFRISRPPSTNSGIAAMAAAMCAVSMWASTASPS